MGHDVRCEEVANGVGVGVEVVWEDAVLQSVQYLPTTGVPTYRSGIEQVSQLWRFLKPPESFHAHEKMRDDPCRVDERPLLANGQIGTDGEHNPN